MFGAQGALTPLSAQAEIHRRDRDSTAAAAGAESSFRGNIITIIREAGSLKPVKFPR
jgi:hypothetical protein